jgi:hypothetical protein
VALFAYLRAIDDPSRAPRAGTVDWTTLLADAEAAGLEPALGSAIARVGSDAPPETAARLARRVAEATARHLVLARALGSILAAFAEAGIPLVPLKGPVLADMWYPHPALRPSSDLDLLIDSARTSDADTVLRRAGYRPIADAYDPRVHPAHDGPLVYDGLAGVRVDLHRRLLAEPRFAWNEPASRDVWTRLRVARWDGRDVLVLAPEDLVVYLACHLAAHHGFDGVVWHWDIARVLRQAAIDWNVVIERSTQWQVRRALYFSLREVARLFDVGPPAAVMAALRPSGPRAVALRTVLSRAQDARRRALVDLIVVLAIDRWPALASAAQAVCWPPAVALAARYPMHTSPARRRLAHGRRCGALALGVARAIVARSR